MADSKDPFSRDYSKDFASLKGKRSSSVLNIVVFISIFLPALLVLSTSFQSDQRAGRMRQIRQELKAAQLNWASDLLEKQGDYLSWLEHYGTLGEVRAFEMLSQILMQGAIGIASSSSVSDGNPSFLMRTYISLDFALLRVAFIAFAAWRLWFFVFLMAVLYGYSSIRVHEAADFLGETGNGRLFYSGIRGALENLTKEGIPSQQVVGLACPSFVPLSEARSSSLARLLEQYGVLNQTNLRLIAILLAHKNWPLHVARPREESLLESAFEGASLVDGSLPVLRAALELHELYQQGEIETDALGPLESCMNRSMSLDDYEHFLKLSLHRVLTEEMRQQIASLSVVELACTVLAYQAGKVIAYGFEGERWVRKSPFSQLTARAVLHSIPEFAKEFDTYSRQRIRHALIYGSRSSIYGPVRFARDLSPQSRALRQWVEVLMATPHELDEVADRVELFGVLYEINLHLSDILFQRLALMQSDKNRQTISSQTNLAFLPLEELVSIMHEALKKDQFKRLEELVSLVSQQQRLYSMSIESETDSVKSDVPAYERIFESLDSQQIAELARTHELPEQVIRDWSSLRNVLNSFGWLARRVGDYSVSDTSIIFAIFQASTDDQERNAHGLVGRSGMVALRGTRFQEKWGKNWTTRFRQMKSANMAETREHYERQMQGIKDEVPAENEAAGGAVEI